MAKQLLPVVLQHCRSYRREAVVAAVDRAVGLLGLAGSLGGKVVLLKPNLISSGPPLACTDGQFIAGVAQWFRDQGARVVLGDSPAFGSATRVCHSLGLIDELNRLGVRLVDFMTPKRLELAGGARVVVAAEALAADLFVGLPRVKAHGQMYVTLAVKNTFGIVKGVEKAKLHMVHGADHDRFAGLILDLVALLPAQLHLADGIVAMHRTGPLDGQPLTLNCMAASCCPVALDNALLDLLELERRKSPLWRVAAKRRLPGADRQNLDFPLLRPEAFHGTGFVAPETLAAIRFNPGRLMRGLVKRLVLKVAR